MKSFRVWKSISRANNINTGEKKKKKDTEKKPTAHIKSEKGDSTTGVTIIKKIRRWYYEKFMSANLKIYIKQITWKAQIAMFIQDKNR